MANLQNCTRKTNQRMRPAYLDMQKTVMHRIEKCCDCCDGPLDPRNYHTRFNHAFCSLGCLDLWDERNDFYDDYNDHEPWKDEEEQEDEDNDQRYFKR